MKSTGLFIATAVLAILIGVLYWSNHHKPAEDAAAKPAPDSPPKILSLTPSDITAVSIHHKDQPQLDLSRNASGDWQITAPRPLGADQQDVSSMLSTFSSLNSERLLDEKASDLAPYGLANSDLQVDITLKDNKTQRLVVGKQTPTGNAYYAMLAGDPRLFTIASYNKTSLDKSVNDLRDKRLLTADLDKVSQIELLPQASGKKQAVTFARDKDSWHILKPVPCRADQEKVEDVVRTLRDLKMNLAADDDAKAAAAFRSASPFVAIKVTGASGAQELEIRKSKDDYYARSSAVTGFYKTMGSVGTTFNKGFDDFRNKRLFDLGYQSPEKIEIRDGAKSNFLTRSGADWWGPNGNKLDDSSVEPVVEKIRALVAIKFPDSGFATPAIHLLVISNDGKRTERVAFAKVGDLYIAKRENEPELYGIAASSIKELEELAEKVKPYTAQK